MSRSDSNDRQSVIRAEFAIQNQNYPFVGASKAEECTFEMAEMVPRNGGRYAEFFQVRDADPNRIVDMATEYETVDAALLEAYDRGGLLEFVVSDDCPAVTLAENGGLPRTIRSARGEGRIVAEIPHTHDASTVIEAFLDDTPGTELVSKREVDSFTPLFSNVAFEHVLRTQLTDRQREVLRTAFDAGYYEWPREATGEEVAAELGITSPTFSEHIHAIERKLLSVVLDEPSREIAK